MADENNIENVKFSFDKTKTYNKVWFGDKDDTGEVAPQRLIDMTIEGNTPEAKDASKPIGLINNSYILSNTVKAQTENQENRAWGSDGKLITGSCLYNADVSVTTGGVTLSLPEDAIKGKVWKHGGPSETAVESEEGTMVDWRTKTGGTGSEEEEWLIVQPGEVDASSWANVGYVVVNEDSTPVGASHSTQYLPKGAYGNTTESASAFTKIKFDVDNIIGKLCSDAYLFGRQGTYTYQMQGFDKDAYLDQSSFSVDEGYAGWASPLTVKQTPVEYVEDTTLTGSYAIYIGKYNPTA